MINFGSIIDTQLLLLILIGIGVITAKTALIDRRGVAALSEMVINVLLPCNILASFINSEGKDIFLSLALMLLVSALVQLASFFLGRYVFFRGVPREQQKVLCYSTLISNATFLGNPVVESIFGASGLVYASVYLLPLRISMWTLGLGLFTGGAKGNAKKIILHPCMMATYLGVLILFTGWKPPAVISRVVFSIGNCLAAVSMIVVGHILAQVNVRNILNRTVIWFSLVRLVLLPLALMGILLLLKVNPLVTGVAATLTGMPAPTTASIMANKYGGDSALASKLTLVSVVLSMLTIPVTLMLLNRILAR
jgi:predicted permease